MNELTTCWEMIHGAAAGEEAESASFAAIYRPLIVDFLGRRWRLPAARQEIDDAAQETLLECLREHGALTRAAATAPRRLRPFLFGVTLNVARRFEAGRAMAMEGAGEWLTESGLSPPAATTPALEFDRAWAQNVLRQARRSFEAASGEGDRGMRPEILRLRIFEGLPIREIARRSGQEASKVHYEYAAARQEFRTALVEVLRFESSGAPFDIDQEIDHLLPHLT